VIYVRFTPESRHREPDFGVSENRRLADGNDTLATRRQDDSGFALWGRGRDGARAGLNAPVLIDEPAVVA